MTPVDISVVRDALRKAGLLVSESATLPQFVQSITDDSRLVSAGALFVAVRGSEQDGHDYLGRAERAGASVAVVGDATCTSLPSLVVSDTRRAVAVAASAFYGHPARTLRLAAVTGTNGKTTTVGMLRHLLDEPTGTAASIGTLGVLTGSMGMPLDGGSGLTTPGPVELQRVLRILCDRGVRSVAVETSSHALHQGRIDGVEFEAAVFTNFTRDHLDYHGTMEAYLAAKGLLVALVHRDGTAVINADDSSWHALPRAARQLTFGLTSTADVRAENIRYSPRGSTWDLAIGREQHHVQLPLIGDFNVANALGAAAAAHAMHVVPAEIARRLSTLPQVPGRLEIIAEHPTVLRDYAHTPDALGRALDAVRPFTTGRLIVVFGCGGDRDRGKRPEMGRIAEAQADYAIVTSDNPRTEDPESILDDIEMGMTLGEHDRIEDRRDAIARAISSADRDDVIVLAGKGHETYQIRGTVKHHFDEQIIVRDIIAELVR